MVQEVAYQVGMISRESEGQQWFGAGLLYRLLEDGWFLELAAAVRFQHVGYAAGVARSVQLHPRVHVLAAVFVAKL